MLTLAYDPPLSLAGSIAGATSGSTSKIACSVEKVNKIEEKIVMKTVMDKKTLRPIKYKNK